MSKTATANQKHMTLNDHVEIEKGLDQNALLGVLHSNLIKILPPSQKSFFNTPFYRAFVDSKI